jgi:hypothetical protein
VIAFTILVQIVALVNERPFSGQWQVAKAKFNMVKLKKVKVVPVHK